MNKRDNPPRGRPEAIVRPAAPLLDVERIAPRAELADFVDYYWLTRWNLREPHRQQVVPQPRVHIAGEGGRLLVHGVSREPFFRTLTGTGQVLGAAFHAGGFRPLLRASVSTVSGTVRTGREVLGIDDRSAARGDDPVAALEEYLLRVAPEPDATATLVTGLVGEVAQRPDIVRADQLARHAGLGLRSLQRLFAEYVGIGPKWVVQRSRILDATAAAHAGEPVEWADLAQRLGFSDQAHLTRVFAQIVGAPPSEYRRRAGNG
ncbi:helix-turn-helix domain-containing protein [Saccharopolyspora taberi]|uniref:AraC family transcriptional regulator n=1 Tax=Saccharopolyspora taberi TaxID=60895 RepID=UPI0031DB1E3D